jgi:type IV secretion system protein VirB6
MSIDINNLISSFIQSIDAFGTHFVVDSYKSIALLLTGNGGRGIDIVTPLLVIYVIFYGVSIWSGTARGSVVEMTYKLFRVFVIYSLAVWWGDFQQFIYDGLQAIPLAVSNTLLTQVNLSVGQAAPANIGVALDNLLKMGLDTFAAFTKNAGVLNPGGYFAGLVFVIPCFLLVAYSAFLIILAKLFLWLLFGLAPLFILLALFTQTTSYFTGWVKAIAHYIVVQILIVAVIAFYVSITSTVMNAIVTAGADSTVNWGYVGTGATLLIIGVLLVNQVSHLAANISGALGLGAPSMGQYFGAGVAATFGAKAVAGGAARGTASVNRGVNTVSNAAGWVTPQQKFGSYARPILANKLQSVDGNAQSTFKNYVTSPAYKMFEARQSAYYGGKSRPQI